MTSDPDEEKEEKKVRDHSSFVFLKTRVMFETFCWSSLFQCEDEPLPVWTEEEIQCSEDTENLDK